VSTIHVASDWDMELRGARDSQVRYVSGRIQGFNANTQPELGSIVTVRFGTIVGNAYVTSLRGNWAGAWEAEVAMTGPPITEGTA
jgi:hypothetical protein